MNPVIAAAIEKLVGKMKSAVSVGTHHVDEVVTLHIKGEVKKFPDETYTPTVSVPLKATMAVMLHLMGFQRDKAINVLSQAMKMAINMNKDSNEEILSFLEDVDAALENVESMTSTLPPQTRTGKTTVKGEMKVLPNVENVI
jgi:hypothetical protein